MADVARPGPVTALAFEARGEDAMLWMAASGGIHAAPLEVEAQGFVHRYWGLLFPDLFIEDDVCAEAGAGCTEVRPDARVDGLSYGGELFIRRPPSHQLSGFLSYTLAWAELDAIPGIDYTPTYDVRHVLNAAGRWNIVEGLSVGARIHFRTGKQLGVWYLAPGDLSLARYEQRLPPFDWRNVTFSREPTEIECPEGLLGPPEQECPVEYVPAIVAPNLGLRGTF